MTAPGAASVTVSRTQVGRDLTINVGTVVRELSGRIGLAPPKLGDWGLVGREEELSRLHTEIQRARDSGSGAAEVVLAGLGGLGKTALALGYLAAHGADYDLVAWIDADNPDLIPAQYRRLVRNVTGQDLAEVGAVAAAKARLADSGDWLVIFDNARCARDLRPFSPGGNGCVLVTTRNLNWSANRRGIVEVGTLPSDVVTRWIDEACPNSDPAAVAGIVDHLDGLPLAIVQAIAYISSRPGETARTYLDKLDSTRGRYQVLADKQPADYPASVATTWDIAMDALSDEAPAALELLRFASYVGPDELPIGLLDGLVNGDVPGALDGLLTYGMIRASTSVMSVHRLVQAITRWPLTQVEEVRYVEAWARHLVAAAPDPSDPASATWYTDMAQHVVTLCLDANRLEVSPAPLASIANNATTFLADHGADRSALSTLEQLVPITERELGTDHLDVAAQLANVGIVHRRLAQFDQALDHLERALHIEQKGLGPSDPRIALTLAAIGQVHEDQGRYEEASSYFDRALAIETSQLGPDHPRTAWTLVHRARVRRTTGDGEAAVADGERALTIQEAAYGPDDPRLAPALSGLGHAYLDLGAAPESVAASERCLHVLESAYGADDPRVASALDGLARATRATGDAPAAAALLERSLALAQSIHGDGHPTTAGIKVNLAGATADCGAPDRAIALYEEALAALTSSYGRTHPHVGRALHDLAQTHASRGSRASVERARDLEAEALAILDAVFGANDPQVATAVQSVASLSDRLGDRNQALAHLRRLLAIYQATHGPTDAATLDLQRFVETYARSTPG